MFVKLCLVYKKHQYFATIYHVCYQPFKASLDLSAAHCDQIASVVEYRVL